MISPTTLIHHVLRFFGLRAGQQEAQPQGDGGDASVQMNALSNRGSTEGNPNPNEPQPSETVTEEDGAQEVIENSHHEDTEEPAPESLLSADSTIVSSYVRDSHETERTGATRGSYEYRDGLYSH